MRRWQNPITKTLTPKQSQAHSQQLCCCSTGDGVSREERSEQPHSHETVELDNEMIVTIMKDVAMGMKFLHFSKIPSQDEELTPTRVLLDSNYRAQLMHFQLSAVRQSLPTVMCLPTQGMYVLISAHCLHASDALPYYHSGASIGPMCWYQKVTPMMLLVHVCDPALNIVTIVQALQCFTGI